MEILHRETVYYLPLGQEALVLMRTLFLTSTGVFTALMKAPQRIASPMIHRTKVQHQIATEKIEEVTNTSALYLENQQELETPKNALNGVIKLHIATRSLFDQNLSFQPKTATFLSWQLMISNGTFI